MWEHEREVERMEAEFGGELPDLNGATVRQRAERLLAAGGPLEDDDLALLRLIVEQPEYDE